MRLSHREQSRLIIDPSYKVQRVHCFAYFVPAACRAAMIKLDVISIIFSPQYNMYHNKFLPS